MSVGVKNRKADSFTEVRCLKKSLLVKKKELLKPTAPIQLANVIEGLSK